MKDMSEMLSEGRLALVIVACLCLAPAGLQAATIINDSFDDGGRTDGADPLDAEWYRVWVTAPTTFSAVAGPDIAPPGGLDTDNALIVDSEHTQDYLVVNLPSDVTLVNPGEFIRLSFKLRLTNMKDYRDTFRFGIFNSGPNKITAEQTNANLSDDHGYVVCMATGNAADVRERITRNPGGSAGSGSLFRISGTPAVETLSLINPAKHIIKDNIPHPISLTLTLSTTGSLLIRWDFNNEIAIAVEDNSASGGPHLTFNEIGFGTVVPSDPPLDYILDDVVVETGQLPACEIVPPCYVRTGPGLGDTSVTVAGINSTATQVNVYADDTTLIGSATLPSPAPGTTSVEVSPLLPGQELSARQVIGGVESCFPSMIKPVVSPNPVTQRLLDGFGDGSRKNDGVVEGPVDDANDIGAPFYLINSILQPGATIAHDQVAAPTLGDDNVLKVDATGGPGTQAYQAANFKTVTLDKLGDFIKLSFDFRITNLQADRNAIRFGLFNSNGFKPTGDLVEDTVCTTHDGYFSTIATATDKYQHLYRAMANTGTYMSLDHELPGQVTPAAYLINDLNPHSLALTITRTDLGGTDWGLEVTYEFDGLAPWVQSDTTVSGQIPVINFDEFGIGVVTSEPVEPSDYVIDNVRVIGAPNPCSAPVFDTDANGQVGSLDMLAFADCATGPSPEPAVFGALSPECKCLDINHDEAIDQNDFSVFQRCVTTGSTQGADPACDD